MTPNQAVLVTAARLRLWVNVKEYGLGGGPRRRALGTVGAETTGTQWQGGEDGVSEGGPDCPPQHQQPFEPRRHHEACRERTAGRAEGKKRQSRPRQGRTAEPTRLTSAVLVTATRVRLCLN
jgi:hypothetical protein